MTESAPTESDVVAIAAHLHVQLRRRTGRVIDVDWLSHNSEYANAVVRFALDSASEHDAPELAIWATRFERAFAKCQRPRTPLLAAASKALEKRRPEPTPPETSPSTALRDSEMGTVSQFGDAQGTVDTNTLAPGTARPTEDRYVWSLR
jgi:hypothetical protein